MVVHRDDQERLRVAGPLRSKDQKGVEISLGVDWNPSGSDHIFDELRTAAEVNEEEFNGAIPDADWIKMITVNPAKLSASLAAGVVSRHLVLRERQLRDRHARDRRTGARPLTLVHQAHRRAPTQRRGQPGAAAGDRVGRREAARCEQSRCLRRPPHEDPRDTGMVLGRLYDEVAGAARARHGAGPARRLGVDRCARRGRRDDRSGGNMLRVAGIGYGYEKDLVAWSMLALGVAQVVGLGLVMKRRVH
jgi:hypothetical protein